MNDRTDALSIPAQVKLVVADRDAVDGWPCCILCGRTAPSGNPLAFSNAHYIPRAQGGLGVERNILPSAGGATRHMTASSGTPCGPSCGGTCGRAMKTGMRGI